MNPWNCCRTCLGTQSLHPIFAIPEYSEKYTKVLLNTTGIKVEPTDSLPLKMCTDCINFVNNSYRFRRKCEESQNMLHSHLDNGHTYEIKLESYILKSENADHIDISDLVKEEKMYNDEGTVNDFIDTIDDNEPMEFDTRVSDVAKPKEVTFKERKKRKHNVDNPIRKTLRSKSGEKKERIKEEIECEYCHKILTSKLSLRNHYKIHTGFDVVCEHCGKKFITRRLLLMHCRAKHGYEKTDKCSFCDYRASNAEQVKIHERLHTGEKPYVCSSCGAGFHRKSSFLQHVAIHLPDKTVQCDQCPARFKSVTLMRIHKNRHRAPQYSFKCRVCENSFARRRNVVRHLQRIHGLEPTQEHIDKLKIA